MHRYDRLTWQQIAEAVERRAVVMLPVGDVEDHGYHLPLDVDNLCAGSLCETVAERMGGEALVLPTQSYGYDPHHLDFPGTISISMQNFLNFMTDITNSVAHHGFRRIVIVNGHGSNGPLCEYVARRTTLESEALCAAVNHWDLIGDKIAERRESQFPGGISHACELETSLYLHLAPERVDMSKAVKEIPPPRTSFNWNDLGKGSPVKMVPWWSQLTRSGVIGDPTLATAEKGKFWFEAEVERLIQFCREFRALELPPRSDRHAELARPAR
jgi:creatinine amidohydrolase